MPIAPVEAHCSARINAHTCCTQLLPGTQAGDGRGHHQSALPGKRVCDHCLIRQCLRWNHALLPRAFGPAHRCLSPALRCIARSQCLSSSSPPVPLLARTRAQIFDDRTHTHTKIFYSWRRTPCCGYGTSSAVGRMGPVRSRPTMARSSCFVSLSMYVCLCFTRMHDSAYSLET